jgi:threonine synthase
MHMDAYSLVEGLRCTNCGATYGFELMLGGCPACVEKSELAMLDPFYQTPAAQDFPAAPTTLWDGHKTLPLPDSTCRTTLGEGGSPLLPVGGVDANWWVKYEAVNPTHSYKDRTNAVAVSVARHFGRDKVICTSTGNHGVALTAYAASAGVRCLVLMPADAPALSLQEMRFFGAEVAIVEDGQIVPLLESLVLEHGWYVSQRNAPGVGGRKIGNPYGMEGYKTISYEIFHQLGRQAPDKVVLPVGGGDAAWGVYKGFRELRDAGLADRVPQVIAAQSAKGAPLVNAIEHDLSQVAPVDTSATIAFSIVERQTGDLALQGIRASQGTAVAVTDQEIRQAARIYAGMGVCVEASSSAALAGALKLLGESRIERDETVVMIGTGAGLRWPATFDADLPPIPRVAGTVASLQRVMRVD